MVRVRYLSSSLCILSQYCLLKYSFGIVSELLSIINHKCEDFYLDSQFYSTDLNVCPYATNTLSYYSFTLSSEISKDEPPNSVLVETVLAINRTPYEPEYGPFFLCQNLAFIEEFLN